MPSFELEFEVFCTCGKGLCPQASTGETPGRRMPYVTVAPCEDCLDNAKTDGHEEGYKEGEADCGE